jgi:hypothetical protein
LADNFGVHELVLHKSKSLGSSKKYINKCNLQVLTIEET